MRPSTAAMWRRSSKTSRTDDGFGAPKGRGVRWARLGFRSTFQCEQDGAVTGKKWAFEDFAEGQSLDLGSKTVTAEEIVEFAGEFDPQPMHLDEEAGKASLLGGLGASGWHTCCM